MPRQDLFIENSVGLSGSTVSLATLLNHLNRNDVVPYVAVSRPEQATFLLQQLREPTDVAVIRPAAGLKGAGWLRRLLGPSGIHVRGLRRAGWKVAGLIDMLIVTLPYSLRLRRFARGRELVLIHHNNGFDVGAVFLSLMLGIPLVAYQRGDEWNSLTVRWLATRVTRFIANSVSTRRSLDALGVPPERVRVIYPPVDLESFIARRSPGEVRDSLGLQAGGPCFGMIGMLLPWKGQTVFLRAAARVLERFPHACVLVVGGPPSGGEGYARELRNLARELGIGDRVIFTGLRSDVADILPVLDIVVHASVDPEPFGRVIIEAMALRRPVVASRAGGPTEIIEDGKTGLLVAPGARRRNRSTWIPGGRAPILGGGQCGGCPGRVRRSTPVPPHPAQGGTTSRVDPGSQACLVRGFSLSAGGEQQRCPADLEVHALSRRPRPAGHGVDARPAGLRRPGRDPRAADSSRRASGSDPLPGREARALDPRRVSRERGGARSLDRLVAVGGPGGAARDAHGSGRSHLLDESPRHRAPRRASAGWPRRPAVGRGFPRPVVRGAAGGGHPSGRSLGGPTSGTPRRPARLEGHREHRGVAERARLTLPGRACREVFRDPEWIRRGGFRRRRRPGRRSRRRAADRSRRQSESDLPGPAPALRGGSRGGGPREHRRLEGAIPLPGRWGLRRIARDAPSGGRDGSRRPRGVPPPGGLRARARRAGEGRAPSLAAGIGRYRGPGARQAIRIPPSRTTCACAGGARSHRRADAGDRGRMGRGPRIARRAL